MTFLEAPSYVPGPAPSPHDTADDASLSSDLDGDEQVPVVDYWNEDEDDERMR